MNTIHSSYELTQGQNVSGKALAAGSTETCLRLVPCRSLVLFIAFISAAFASTAETVSAHAAGNENVSSRRKFNLNTDWRFIRNDVEDAHAIGFDESQWSTVSCPHTWNDVDTFNNFGTGGHQGETDLWTGTAWYRKKFTLPKSVAGKKVIIEFEGVRQIADVYINGVHLGQDKTGFIPFGFDLTPHLNSEGNNLLAVKVNNTVTEKLYTGPTPWHHQNWHPPHGGIYRNVYLHVLDPVHVTLPLFANLETEGTYAWTKMLSMEQAEIGIAAQIENSEKTDSDVKVTFTLLDRNGKRVKSSKETAKISAGERVKVATTIKLDQPHLWEPAYPYIYEIRTEVRVDGRLRDTSTTPFGIRNFRFDRDTGFWINGHPLKLHGWGQKPIESWAGLGAGIPNWMHDYTLKMMDEAGGNLLRWGHCAGPPTGADSCDKYGFVTIMPGVDGEKDCDGEAWQTRTNAFRDMIVYYRNHPSICIWEGGNYSVSDKHAAELKALTTQWDPNGKRYFSHRMSTPTMLESIDLELGTVGRTRALPSLAVVETEYDRTETPRRVWDKFSPPDFGNLGELHDLNTYKLTSEGFAINAIKEWWTLFGSKPEHCGGANWIFSDGPHGTRQRTDCARATGEVDAVRLPKEAYFALQATWDDQDRVHLIGHWNYPAETVKPMYAVANADRAALFVNGKSLGDGKRSLNTLFTWPEVRFEPGEIKVVAFRNGTEIASQVKQTAGEPAAIRLTAITAPGGWRADGADIALIDFEVVDAQGLRCPTDQERVDFEVSGPCLWRGGYNSGKEHSTNHLYLDTECGINRVSLRSTLKSGEVNVTATRAGLKPATLRLSSIPFSIVGGLAEALPVVYESAISDSQPEISAADLLELSKLRGKPIEKATKLDDSERAFSMFAYTGTGFGGIENQFRPEMLAFTDDARIFIKEVPEHLKNSIVIRTAKGDAGYWAADYIVATAGKEMDLFVAHDQKAPLPDWLKSFRKTKDKVRLNRGTMNVFTKRIKTDEALRISGNVDQGKKKPKLNLIFFCKLVE